MLMRADAAALRARTTDFAPFARIGAIALGALTATFGIWALFVPIQGAVIASGLIVNDGKIQVIRHETGGVVDAIKVREGDTVAKDQVIALLSPANARAARDQLEARLLGLDAKLARLAAEASGTPFVFSASGNPALVAQLTADQQREYDSRAARHASDNAVLAAQLATQQSQKDGAEASIAAYETQIASIGEDIALRRQAASNGYGRAAQLRELEREQARLEAALASSRSSLAALAEQIAEAAARLDKSNADFAEQVAQDTADARKERSEVVEQQQAAQNALDRVEIRAASAGTISKLYVNTPGSAIEPYAPLAEIVPDDAPLIVEAMVDPLDIDEVRSLQTAEIVFSGFDRNQVDSVDGIVEFISPSSRIDERTGMQFYTVRLNVPREGLPHVLPGMPAQTYFHTGDHTFAQYLLAPILDSFRKAFR
jgi:HlyD family type I secretion membrane fusion protein